MALSTENSVVYYTGNGSTSTPYPITFKFLSVDDIEVSKRTPEFGTDSFFPEWEVLDPADYTVTRDDETGLGEVTTDPAITAFFEQVRIKRIVPITQETEYPVSGSFPAKSHETALDKLTMICQDLNQRVAELEAQITGKIQTVLELDLGGGEPLGQIPNDTWAVIKDTSNDSVTLWVGSNDGVGGVTLIAAP